MKPSRAEFSLASSKKRTQPSSTRRIFPAVNGYVGYIGKAALSLLPSEFHTQRSLMAHSSRKPTEQEILEKVVEPTQDDSRVSKEKLCRGSGGDGSH